MGEDEYIAMFIHGAVGIVVWTIWIVGVVRTRQLGRSNLGRWAVVQAPVICVAILVSLLEAFAASDVRGTIYVWFYTIMGAAWIGGACAIFAWLGVHPRDDVAERRNQAAAVCLIGAVVGFTCAFAGSNFGDGPGWFVVAGCGVLAMGTLMLTWILVAACTHAVEAVTVERDMPSALRLACFLAAAGLILGRAVAGDYVDLEDTVADFVALAWPVPVLALVEVGIGGSTRPCPRTLVLPAPLLLRGFVPGSAYLAASIAYVVSLGWW